ncbi:NADH-quinone oxidoreductase subunit M [Algivirga pacifica]|uniref:NADH-quinone oxidoreductase subunit M n=1 Tax=Algivirga pacifica TaxID=1162670 RepID=A0ABP9D438_9BACT
MTDLLLPILVFLPIVMAIVVLLLPRRSYGMYKGLTIGATTVQLLISLMLLGIYHTDIGAEAAGVVNEANFQLITKTDWITLSLGEFGKLKADFFLGLDGVSLPMVVLTAIVMMIGAISSFEIKDKQRGFYALYLLLAGTIMGCFVALDMFLFYLFFEFMLLPMYFLIGLWGGKRSEYAAIKFFIYTLFGSILILIVMIGLSVSVMDPAATAIELGLANAGELVPTTVVEQVQQMLAAGQISSEYIVRTFNVLRMMEAENYIPDSLLNIDASYMLFGTKVRFVAFLMVLIGFGIKLPVVPVHTWLPDAHVEAPTSISVVLAGILLKVGGYGMLRMAYGIFPDGGYHFAWWIGLFGVISIIYGAFVALGTHNLKRLIAYSSVSHMGFVALGIASQTGEGVTGAIYQMFSHGIISSLLFLLAGVLYYRTKNLEINDYSGLYKKMPRYTILATIGFFASLGLPGFSGFIAEVIIFLGAFSSNAVNGLLPRWMPIVSTLGLILSAAYYLWALQRMFLGKFQVRVEEDESKLIDLSTREMLMMVPLAITTFVFGVYPQFLIDMMSASVEVFIDFTNEMGPLYLGTLLK